MGTTSGRHQGRGGRGRSGESGAGEHGIGHTLPRVNSNHLEGQGIRKTTLYPLPSSPDTVHLGYFSSALKPALTIHPGDRVIIETLAPLSPDEFEAGGLAPAEIPPALRHIWKEVRDRGPGPHILTGPIFIKEALPGDTLEVHIKEIKITAPIGFNSHEQGSGALPEEFPYEATRILRLDLKMMTSEVVPGVVIPLNPFLGIMGVAPTPKSGKVSSEVPGVHGGNLDNKELVAGTILYLPVHVRGALFSAGDGHAAQGDGEVNVCAIETFLKGTLQFFVRKNKELKWPRAETPTHFITMGFHEDLDVAAKLAVMEMLEYLVQEKGLCPEDAYMVTSLIVDFRVTQLVNGVKGIHAMLPKRIFRRKYGKSHRLKR